MRGWGESRFWLLLRIVAPILIVLVAYANRAALLDAIYDTVGLGIVLKFGVTYSTLDMRILILGGAIIVFAAFWFAIRKLGDTWLRSIVYASGIAIFIAVSLSQTNSTKLGLAAGAFAFLLITLNSLALRNWNSISQHHNAGHIAHLAFKFGIGLEALLPQPYSLWAAQSLKAPSQVENILGGTMRFLPGAMLAAGILALLTHYAPLMQLSQKMFKSSQVRIVLGPSFHEWSPYDVSDVAQDPATGDLYLCGDGLREPQLLRAGKTPAISIGIVNDDNEFCEFSPSRNLFYTIKTDGGVLYAINPDDFSIVQQIEIPDLPDGEVLLALHEKAGLLAVVGENESGKSTTPDIRIVDLDTFAIVRIIDADAGYVITHPDRPVIYINHFAMDIGIRAYDMITGDLIATSDVFGRSDRMAFDKKRGVLLATSPESGKIRRFDETTISELSAYKADIGTRGIAIDSTRDLLLTASFLTNTVKVIDLENGQILRRYYLGPWLRDVSIDSEKGMAYVGSRYAFYELDYLN